VSKSTKESTAREKVYKSDKRIEALIDTNRTLMHGKLIFHRQLLIFLFRNQN